MVVYVKQQNVISDYSQIALLLRSVKYDHSGPYLEALEARGIPAFCPRARAYFDNDEVRLMVACYAIIFGYYGDGRGTLSGQALRELAAYVDSGLVDLGRNYGAPHPLARDLQSLTREIANLKEGESLDSRPADYLYRLLALEPFNFAIPLLGIVDDVFLLPLLLRVLAKFAVAVTRVDIDPRARDDRVVSVQ